MNTYDRTIFYANNNNEIVEVSLADFLKEFCAGDPARASYVKHVEDYEVSPAETEDRYTFSSEGTILATCDWHDMRDWKEQLTARGIVFDIEEEEVVVKDAVIEDRWELREGLHSNILRDRLISTHETEEEAEEALLDGSYWAWCNGKISDAPSTADTREELEAMIADENAA